MLRIINIDVSVAKTAWTLFSHSGYGIMFMDGGDPDFILKIAFTGNELTQSAIYLERGGLIHFPANFAFERFYITHLADTGTIKIAILEKPSMDRPIYQRGGTAQEGQGNIKIVSQTAPAVGGEVVITQSVGTKWRIINFLVELTTSAITGDRIVYLQLMFGAIERARFGLQAVITNSITRAINYSDASESEILTGRTLVSGQLSRNLIVDNQMIISTLTENLDAGDQYGDPQLLVEEWI